MTLHFVNGAIAFVVIALSWLPLVGISFTAHAEAVLAWKGDHAAIIPADAPDMVFIWSLTVTAFSLPALIPGPEFPRHQVAAFQLALATFILNLLLPYIIGHRSPIFVIAAVTSVLVTVFAHLSGIKSMRVSHPVG